MRLHQLPNESRYAVTGTEGLITRWSGRTTSEIRL
jgi:hypothetical protein